MTAISRRGECQWSFRFRDAKRIEALCSQTSNRSCPLLFTQGFKLIMTASGLLFVLKDRVVYHFIFEIYDVSFLQRTRAYPHARTHTLNNYLGLCPYFAHLVRWSLILTSVVMSDKNVSVIYVSKCCLGASPLPLLLTVYCNSLASSRCSLTALYSGGTPSR